MELQSSALELVIRNNSLLVFLLFSELLSWYKINSYVRNRGHLTSRWSRRDLFAFGFIILVSLLKK